MLRWTAPILLLALAVPAPAQACVVAVEADLSDMHMADLILVGSISDYVVYQGRRGDMPDRAVIRVQVHRVLRGSAPGSILLELDNSTFAVSPELLTFEPALIAATWGDPWHETAARDDEPPIATPRPAMMRVMRPPCSTMFILPAPGPQFDGDLMAALADGDLDWDGYAAISQASLTRLDSLPAQYRAPAPQPAWWAGLLTIVLTAAIPALTGRQRRRRNQRQASR